MEKRPNGSFLFGYHEPTKTEARLASALRKAKVPFEQEVPIDHYRVDFLCDKWLVIEVDGESHLTGGAIFGDRKRQKDIEDLGFTVLRIPSSELWREEAAKKWAKRIRDMVRKGRIGERSGEPGSAYIREQVEKVKEELREKAVDKGLRVAEERRKAVLKPTSFEKMEKGEIDGETMEDYFGRKGESFERLLKRFEPPKFIEKDEDLSESDLTYGKNSAKTEAKTKRTKSPFRRK